jgi:raffinose/stachyose/melibiose transport system permease protein
MIAVLIVLLILFIFPFIMVVINVFKTKADITSNPLALIGKHGFTLKNFPKAIDKMNFWQTIGNSAFVTTISTVLIVLLSAMCAYVVTRYSEMEGVQTAVYRDDRFHGRTVPGADDPAGLHIRRHTPGILNHRWTLIFMHIGFSRFHGRFHLLRRDPFQHTAGTGRGCGYRRLFEMADLLENRVPAAQAYRRHRSSS